MTARKQFSIISLMIIFLFSWLLPALAAYAIKKDADEPIRIKARSVVANDKTGVAVYSGNVLAEQGRLSIKADRIEIRARNNKSDLLTATGKPVKLRQRPEKGAEEIYAEARRIDYRVSDRKLEMTGEVTLRRGEDLFTGSMLYYDLDAKNLIARGDDGDDGRIHAVIQPGIRTVEPASNP